MCCHYWIIDPVSKPVSKGRCRICGSVRMFNNAYHSSNGDLSADRARVWVADIGNDDRLPDWARRSLGDMKFETDFCKQSSVRIADLVR